MIWDLVDLYATLLDYAWNFIWTGILVAIVLGMLKAVFAARINMPSENGKDDGNEHQRT